uniref:Uncharacterized protein n=1 Tax=Arundo donax TaxID=35708 RepID=A0A0A9FT59_ARUDO
MHGHTTRHVFKQTLRIRNKRVSQKNKILS